MDTASASFASLPRARRPVVLVEDDAAGSAMWDLSAAAAVGIDVVVCSGPAYGEVCELVTEGRCPIADPDVVVCALESEWRPSVERAWHHRGVRVVGLTDPVAWPAHLGAALQRDDT